MTVPRAENIVFAWDMHYSCNFECPYCFYTTAGWRELAAKNTYKTAAEWTGIWAGIFERYGCCRLKITAGEPFTYPGFTDVVKEITAFHSVQITSNCSLTEAIDEFTKRVSPEKAEFDCTFHPRQLAFGIFLKNVLALRKAGFNANVCYLAHPGQIPEMEHFKKMFLDNGIRMNLAMFWGTWEGRSYPHDYTPEEKNAIKNTTGYSVGPETVGLEPVPVKGKLCGAGQKYAVIQADGKVYRCGQLGRDFQSIGSIFDPAFRLFDEGAPCAADFCKCKEYQSAWENKEAEDFNTSGKATI